jgi:predicted nucleic acid-binding protein
MGKGLRGKTPDLAALPIVRYEHTLFLSRVWQLRNSLSACDVVYISLSEALAATLLTRDLRLKSAAGHTAMIETF